MESLFQGRFEDYLNTLRNQNPLWLFVHVPKTAGSSLNAELTPLLQPNYHIFIDHAQAANVPYHELFNQAVTQFIDAAIARRLRYATGHITAAHIERITSAVPNVKPISLLREPVSRFVSDYRYQCSPMHPTNEDFRAKFPTIEHYIEQRGEWNKAAAYLVPDAIMRSGDAEACIAHIMRSYSFIGIQEMYPLSLRVITTLAGSPRRPQMRKRVNEVTPETKVSLTPAMDIKIRERNSLDIAIYTAFQTRFSAVRADLVAYLDENELLPAAE